MEISIQLGIQRNNLEQKSQTIVYNHDKLVNITKQVKNNISLRRIEFSIIKRVRELKLNRWGRCGGKKKHQVGVNKDNIHDWRDLIIETSSRQLWLSLLPFQISSQLETRRMNYLNTSLTKPLMPGYLLRHGWKTQLRMRHGLTAHL